MRKASNVFIILGLALLVGFFVRYSALSSYIFYPDGYVQIIVAENIKNFGGVIGTLGNGGMLYPDFFGWTRPIYPILILVFDFFYGNIIPSARTVSFLLGLFAIPLAYLYVRKALTSKLAGCVGAILLAISWNHAVWGGYILSDTTGVFFLLLFLVCFFSITRSQSEIGDYKEILIGVVFFLAILSRYEYALLVIPVLYLLYNSVENRKQFIVRFFNILAGAFLTFSVFYYWLSPFSIASGATSQVGSLLSSLGTLNLTALTKFVLTDPIIFFFGICGLFWMFYKNEMRHLAVFSAFSILLLEIIYYQINPEMQRYFVHLIPFILLPASYFAVVITEQININSKKMAYIIIPLIMLVFGWQIYYTYVGLHKEDDGIWFMAGYEELASKRFALDNAETATQNSIVIASFPEPYFLFNRQSTQSITDSHPFIYISGVPSNTLIYIVEDEGMRKVFPVFTKFLDSEMQDKITYTFPIDAMYRYGGDIESVYDPVIVYIISLNDLKLYIEKYNETNSPSSML